MIVKQVLVPIDLLSPDSDAAFELTATLLKGLGARVKLLHVLSPRSSLLGMVPGADGENPDRSEEKAAIDHLNSLAAKLRTEGIAAVEVMATPGYPADEILRHARVEKVDLIIMGTHGRRGLSRMLIGSVVAEVMKSAECVVITVHAPKGALN